MTRWLPRHIALLASAVVAAEALVSRRVLLLFLLTFSLIVAHLLAMKARSVLLILALLALIVPLELTPLGQRSKVVPLLIATCLAGSTLLLPSFRTNALGLSRYVALFIAAVAGGLLYSPHPVAVAETTLYLMIGALMAAALARSSADELGAISLMILLVAGMEALLAIAQFLTSRPLLVAGALGPTNLSEATNIPGLFRGLGTFYHANGLSLFLVLVLPLCVPLIRRGGLPRRVALGAAAVVVVGVCASLSRAGLITLALLGILLVLSRASRRSGVLMILPLLAFATIAAVALGPGAKVLERFTDEEATQRDMASNATRRADMRAAVAQIREAPFFGRGLGTSPLESERYGGAPDQSPHNTYLDVLQGGGLLLGGIFLVLFVRMCRKALRAWRAAPEGAIALFSLSIYGLFEPLLFGFIAVVVFTVLSLTLMGATWAPPHRRGASQLVPMVSD